MKNLYVEKLKRMSDEEIMDECLQHGNKMGRGDLSTEEDKKRAYYCFHEASKRESLKEDRDMILAALRVLRLLQ